ncbi:putative salt tolerance-like protein [Platanthera guangdongensis]|uniref:Salt tolerance-like protein n=1 Tax=Platanthera guangdongensis TaxID=2320717 RepID=A0ABR2M0W2_9ASPA
MVRNLDALASSVACSRHVEMLHSCPLPNPLHLFRRLAGARRLVTKLQCDVCGAEQASVLCCADEVVLCTGCNVRIHSANKLGGKHCRFFLQLRRRVHGAGIESISL